MGIYLIPISLNYIGKDSWDCKSKANLYSNPVQSDIINAQSRKSTSAKLPGFLIVKNSEHFI